MTSRPNVGDLVIANINKIARFGAYCTLPEYNNTEAFLPLREVSSGWIKNIHEFIHVGQRCVCKVVFIDNEKATIDISLKKVTPKESKDKINAYSLETRVKALYARALKASGLNAKADKIEETVLGEFSNFANLFYNASENTPLFEGSDLPKKFKETFLKLLNANKRDKVYTVSYLLTLQPDDANTDINQLHHIFTKVDAAGVEARYISAPKYRLIANGDSFAAAEDRIKAVEDILADMNAKYKIEKEKRAKKQEDILARAIG